MMFGRGGAEIEPILSMVGMHTATSDLHTNPTQLRQTKLSLLTDVGRRYPGYPSALSPSIDAKQLFPSPYSESGSSNSHRDGAATSHFNRASCTSPMNVDSAGASGRVNLRVSAPHVDANKSPESELLARVRAIEEEYVPKNEHFILRGWDNMTLVPQACIGSMSLRSVAQCTPPRSPSVTSVNPTSPTSPMSPRSAMLKTMASKQAFQSLSHKPSSSPLSPPPFVDPSLPSDYLDHTPLPAFPIANGFETSTASPFDPTGTLLKYTSSRRVTSGLLAVKPLNEAEVAEYRFWRPCGRRACAFGCGSAGAGENRAARRLFRSAEEVRAEESESLSEDTDGETFFCGDTQQGEKEWEKKMEQEELQTER